MTTFTQEGSGLDRVQCGMKVETVGLKFVGQPVQGIAAGPSGFQGY